VRGHDPCCFPRGPAISAGSARNSS
jgi:hypothetical protein